MKVSPIKTRLVHPPKDEIWDIIDDVAAKVTHERTVVAITTKIVSLHEGRTVPAREDTLAHKDELAKQETAVQAYVERQVSGNNIMFTQLFGTIMPSAGIDASNANSHLILLPEDPMRSAFEILTRLKEKTALKELAVLLVDSETVPLRWGAVGYAVGWSGIVPHYDYRGQHDLFDEKLKISRSNDVDGLAAAAVFAMGEATEQTPVAIIEDAPKRVQFTQPTEPESPDKHFIPVRRDIYRPMIEGLDWVKNDSDARR